jgi:putative ABC transport system permease protein
MQDLRLAFRTLRRRPAFSAIAIATLALGIGANVAVFTVLRAVLLAPLPYADPERIVILNEQLPEFPALSVTRYNYEAWRDRATSFSGIAAFRPTSLTLSGIGEAQRVPAKMITASLLPLLGVTPAEGRGFKTSDDRPGAEAVAIVSAGFAARTYPGGGTVGRGLRLDGRPYTIVGVLPSRFELFQDADVYVPFWPWASTLPEDRGWHPGIIPIARLRPGVTIAQARTEMTAIAAQLAREFPDSNLNTGAIVTEARDLLVQNVRPALLLLTGAVALVLLIACANVANLLLARAVDRQKELSVRMALGAGRLRLLRQLLVESLVLASAGGAAGLLIAFWGVSSFLSALAGPSLPRAHQIEVEWQVALFAAGLSLLTGVLFGLAPALHATRTDIREALSQEGRGGTSGASQRRLRSLLVVGEVGLALVLLVTAGLLLRSFSALTRNDPGFDPARLFVVNLPLSPQAYGDPAVRAAWAERLLARVQSLPSVTGAGLTTYLPMAGSGTSLHFNRSELPPKGPDDYIVAGFRAVSGDYLRTLGVRLRRGRLLDNRDQPDSPPVVVINESMARHYFPDRDPIGQRIQLGTEPDPEQPYLRVVGVVGDIKQAYEAEGKAEMFTSYVQMGDPILTGVYLNTALVVRTAGDPAQIASAVRAAVHDVDPEQPLVNPRTMASAMAGTVAQPRFQMTLLMLFGCLAVALAAIGVYSVMAWTVSQRTPEIGVRMAMGATPGRVVAMVVWQGAQLALAGVALGIIAAVLAAGAMQALLSDIGRLDVVTFAGAAAVLALAALAASYLPARRAARLSPLDALGR